MSGSSCKDCVEQWRAPSCSLGNGKSEMAIRITNIKLFRLSLETLLQAIYLPKVPDVQCSIASSMRIEWW